MGSYYLKLKGKVGNVVRTLCDNQSVVTFTLTTDDEVYDGEMSGKFADSLYVAASAAHDAGSLVEMRGNLRKSYMYGGEWHEPRREVFYPEWFAVLLQGK